MINLLVNVMSLKLKKERFALTAVLSPHHLHMAVTDVATLRAGKNTEFIDMFGCCLFGCCLFGRCLLFPWQQTGNRQQSSGHTHAHAHAHAHTNTHTYTTLKRAHARTHNPHTRVCLCLCVFVCVCVCVYHIMRILVQNRKPTK